MVKVRFETIFTAGISVVRKEPGDRIEIEIDCDKDIPAGTFRIEFFPKPVRKYVRD